MKKPLRYQIVTPPRPQAVEITPDMPPIKKLPPGVAKNSEPSRYRVGDPDHARVTSSKRLLRVTVTCPNPNCNTQNVRMLNRRQLRNSKIKCDQCHSSIGFEWSAVRRG
jgi:hypothetical protein